MCLTEDLVKSLWHQVVKTELSERFPRMTYYEALATYGSDKPDIRYPFKLASLSVKKEGPTEALIFSTHDAIQSDQFPLYELAESDWAYLRTLLAPIANSVSFL